MRYAMCVPLAEIFPWYPRGRGSGCSTPPAAGTVQNLAAALGAQLALPEEKRTAVPSAVQPCTVSAPGCQVRRLGSPPSAGTTYTSVLPAYSPLNAIERPSGEKCGFVVCP